MPSEGVLDTPLSWVTPSSGKGALGKWRAPYRQHRLDSEPGCGDHLTGRRAGGITRYPRGVYERAFKPREINLHVDLKRLWNYLTRGSTTLPLTPQCLHAVGFLFFHFRRNAGLSHKTSFFESINA